MEIWGNACPTHCKLIHKLQKRAVRIITGSPRKTRSEGLYQTLSIIPFPKLHTLSVYTFLYKVINNLAPPIITSCFTFNENTHNHATRQSQNFHIQGISSALRRRSLRHQATNLYNCGDNIDYDTTYPTFKHFIKLLLLNP